jgi:hypothetical protein
LFKITNMKVPYSEQAYIEREKLTQYLLNFDHSDGASKAAFYEAMGFNLSNVDELEVELLRLIDENEINSVSENQHGTKYVVIGTFYGKEERTRLLKTVWLIENTKQYPRLITAYPF